MEFRRRDYFSVFTVLGLAVSVLMAYSYVGAVLYNLTDLWISTGKASETRWLFRLFHSPWTEQLIQYVFVIGASYGIIALILQRIPKFPCRKQKLSLKCFFLCFAAAMGAGYLFNGIGTAINVIVGMFSNKTLEDMNPVLSITEAMSPSMILYVCLVGPFMEELLFRGMLLSRARVFGDRTAVFFTALLFGLMHGNLTQCLYGTAIGLVLGYVAVRTNGIRYTFLLHTMINSFGIVISFGEKIAERIPIFGLVDVYGFFIMILIIDIVVAAIVIFLRYGRFAFMQLTWNNEAPSPYRKYVYLNPGVLLYIVLCLVEISSFLW